MKTQAISFPAGAAFVQRDLKLVAPAAGTPRTADPALHLPEWVDRFARSPTGLYREDLARIRLADQLGNPWAGVETAAPHVRAMFVVFALHAARRRDEAVMFLGKLSGSLPFGANEGPSGPSAPLAFTTEIIAAIDAFVTDATLLRPCADVAARHAYTSTAMMAVLTHARSQAGVLAPGQFAFLKLVDRQLWYALHSLGFPGGNNRNEQPNPRAEALGCRDHWAAECDIGAPIKTPSLERAISAIGSRAGSLFPLEKPPAEQKENAK